MIINKYFNPKSYSENGDQMGFNQGEAYISNLSSDKNSLSTIQASFIPHNVDYWQGSILTKSSFAQFFDPT